MKKSKIHSLRQLKLQEVIQGEVESPTWCSVLFHFKGIVLKKKIKRLNVFFKKYQKGKKHVGAAGSACCSRQWLAEYMAS